MSEENVEIVRKAHHAWNRGHWGAFFDLHADDDIVLRTAEGWPERVHYGKDAVRSFYKGLAETVGGEVVIEDLIDAGDSVVLRSRFHMTGDQSGITGDLVSSQVFTFRKGKIILDEYFWDHQEALEAAGLSE
jgi:ketosteroid isomerase-like protein